MSDKDRINFSKPIQEKQDLTGGDPRSLLPSHRPVKGEKVFISATGGDPRSLLPSHRPVKGEKVFISATGNAPRIFETGASRNGEEGKLDFEGFLSPEVIVKYSEYMHKNRFLEDGSMRDADNWQKGIPKDAYMKSMFRHFMDVWKHERGLETPENQIENLCALLFNVSGLLFETIREENSKN